MREPDRSRIAVFFFFPGNRGVGRRVAAAEDGGTSARGPGTIVAAVTELGALRAVASGARDAYAVQLRLATGLHFAAALVDAYLSTFHAFAVDAPRGRGTVVSARSLGDMCRLSAVAAVAHHAAAQVCKFAVAPVVSIRRRHSAAFVATVRRVSVPVTFFRSDRRQLVR